MYDTYLISMGNPFFPENPVVRTHVKQNVTISLTMCI